jgi:hypothetical protein
MFPIESPDSSFESLWSITRITRTGTAGKVDTHNIRQEHDDNNWSNPSQEAELSMPSATVIISSQHWFLSAQRMAGDNSFFMETMQGRIQVENARLSVPKTTCGSPHLYHTHIISCHRISFSLATLSTISKDWPFHYTGSYWQRFRNYWPKFW